MKKRVFLALDNAVSNGYGEFVKEAEVMEVVVDLLDCDADLGNISPIVLRRFVVAWRNEHQ